MDLSLPCVRVHPLLQPADEPWGAERGVRLARAAEQHTVADFFENPALAKLCMDFLHGDAPCTATGGHCSVIARAASDHGSAEAGCVRSSTGGWTAFSSCWIRQLRAQYVDWFAAWRRLHDMYTDEIPWDIRDLLEFAMLSCSARC